MKISVSMYSVHKVVQTEGWSPVDFVHFAKSIQADGVELLDIYWKDKEKEIPEVLKEVKEQGLVVSAYDVTNNFVVESEEERMQQVEKVKDGIRVAKQLGTNIVRTFCGDLSGDLTYEDGQEWIVDGLKKAAEFAEQEEVYLAIENHGLLAGRSEQVEEIIAKVGSPFVKSTFDTGNFLLVHQDPKQSFDRLKKEIVHVHFKDFRKKDPSEDVNGFRSMKGEELIGTIPGDGQVDLGYVVNGLNENGYDGWLSIEYEGVEDPKEANLECVNRLKKLLS
ncbi:sugar phosphate isomerase/epimerase family protein [Ornithinibacillus halophilus]|uniref:Sugar phosphate isomerase/epimerase n=1 Tax=Ornithinibacillus halophilus TaxID=930117 RepID=A0A1M5E723_9BACI|nr:sugar phosphate isomerase/epimerase family protein [Ornithinibacillus halophilus]SHF75068.1 Sugar phosphate isomerase/epimerase [Ornithinibacillus halophilus]